MKNHTRESLEEARLQGVWDRQDRKAIQNHYGDDEELYAAYLNGYDPNGEIVKMKSLEKQREDNRMECVKNCPPDNGSFCEKHFQIDCEFSRRIGERDNCPNCADQASIAAPGQTVLCKTHDDERHYSEMRKFFDEQINDFHMTSFLPLCSRCGKDAPYYVIIMRDSKMNPLIFAACIDCRNELTLKQNAVRAAQEKIGA